MINLAEYQLPVQKSMSEFNSAALIKRGRRQLGYVGNIFHKESTWAFSLSDSLTSTVDL